MSTRSLLIEIIAGVIQKVLHRTTHLNPNTKTKEIHKRVVGEEYDFGCSPVAEVKVNILEHGGKYPQTLDPDTRTEETHIARALGEEYDFGCAPIIEAETIKGLKHGGNYPQM